MKTQSFGLGRYFVIFIDNYSRCVTVYPITDKSEVLDILKEWEDCKIIMLRADSRGEDMSVDVPNVFKEKGLSSRDSCTTFTTTEWYL